MTDANEYKLMIICDICGFEKRFKDIKSKPSDWGMYVKDCMAYNMCPVCILKQKSIIEFFDITDETHLEAYIYLTQKGVWSPEFYEILTTENIDLPMNWQFTLMEKLALEFIIYLKNKESS